MSKKVSVIWTWDINELREITSKSTSLRQIFVHFGIDPQGTFYKTLYKRLKEDGIDHSHIIKGRKSNKGKIRPTLRMEEIFIENSKVDRASVKRRVYSGNLLPNICCLCKQPPEWFGKKLVLVLDHINGTNNDNRLENLRLLCPNCNSQTDTFCQKKQL